MKVVLFCGGLGTRLREHSDTIPKPLVTIGYRPILWHLMRYYAHYGHRDFILCLGHRGDLIREYFLSYQETMTNDFTLNAKNRSIELKSTDLDDWRITFVDTGLHSNIGQRLLRVKSYLAREEVFLANYADGLSDLPLERLIQFAKTRGSVATFAAVKSSQSFHAVHSDGDGYVTRMGAMPDQPLWINGGYFVLRREIFDYIEEGEELVEKPFERLIDRRCLATFQWDGFWQCMDTFKDKISFDRMEARGQCPWMVWRKHPSAAPLT
ncbi:MAG: glucose-1-phosphate cytidylyltransferase [Rhodanobacteraceae bacterium]